MASRVRLGKREDLTWIPRTHIKAESRKLGVVVHIFNLSTQEARRQRDL